MVLEMALTIRFLSVISHKPFIGNWELVYNAFRFYQLQKDKNGIRLMIVVRKNLLDKIIIEYKTDLINYLYFIFFEIRNLNQ